MKTILATLWGIALLTLTPCANAGVGDKATFPDFGSNHISGEKLSASKLKGKVIFFEYWGINCPPCLAAMPHLQKLYDQYGNKGFMVIGSHSQSLNDDVKKYLEKSKITFPIYQSKSIKEAPCPGGLPYSVLIGADGRIIKVGQPHDIYGLIKDEVAKVGKGYPILGKLELKKYKGLANSFNSKGKALDAKVAPLRKAADGGDTEAAKICQTFDAWVEGEKANITELLASNPLDAADAILTFKVAVPTNKDFDQTMAELKNSPGIRKLQEIRKKTEALQKKQAKGGKVKLAEVEALNKVVTAVKEKDRNEHVAKAADWLSGQLNDITAE